MADPTYAELAKMIDHSLLQPVLMHQIQTFDPRNWQHNLVLGRLFAEEARLIDAGVLGHDFAMLAARSA